MGPEPRRMSVADLQSCNMSTGSIAAIDLFCGIGGLSLGLQQSGVSVVGGIDNDPFCAPIYEANLNTSFIHADVRNVKLKQLEPLWGESPHRLLAGCAPCQPFSSHRRGISTVKDDRWPLLREFGRLVRQSKPDFVTMENVTRLQRSDIFHEFVEQLEKLKYHVAFDVLDLHKLGLPQYRKRLVLVASRLAPIELPSLESEVTTVEDVLAQLPPVAAGQSLASDPMHHTQALTERNMQRIKASTPGGTWRDWPADLRLPCHKRDSGKFYSSVYGRMTWDAPSPTLTTQFFNYGTGRFGHPEQDRALTLREGAILQGFPPTFDFSGQTVSIANMGRVIGNAVPPLLGKKIGEIFLSQIKP